MLWTNVSINILIYAHIELKSHNFTQGILREVLLAYLENGYLLVCDSILVVFIYIRLKMSANIGYSVFINIILIREYLRYDCGDSVPRKR